MTRLGLSFGSVAEVYERVRPAYRDDALDRAAAELELAADATVVDLAAGTGKLTRALERLFAEVVAVEPDERMRARNPGALAGSAEAIPLADGSADAVFVGDAFHWFDAAVALREIARVLRPRGGLALVWNHWFETLPPIPPEARALLDEPFERTNHASESNRAWRDAFVGSAFEPLRETTYRRDLAVGERHARRPVRDDELDRRAPVRRA